MQLKERGLPTGMEWNQIKNQLLLIAALLFFVDDYAAAQALNESRISYGLSFASHEVSKDQRTSLNLTPGDPFTVKGSFSISFDVCFRRSLESYGYIFRLIGDDVKSFDFLANSFTETNHDLLFVDGNQETNISFDLDPSAIKSSRWLHVELRFDRDRQELTTILDGRSRKDKIDLKELSDFKLFFGANDYKRFATSDVPPMNIKNIKIFDDPDLILNWELKQHLQSRTYDLAKNQKAEVNNASWILDTHTKWKKRLTFKTALHPQIAFQEDQGTIHVADEHALYSYNISDGQLKTTEYRSGNLLAIWSNQMIYDPYRKKLIQYEFKTGRINDYDFNSKSWKLNDLKRQPEPSHWHHNAFFSPIDSNLYTFGGYGFFTYKNDIQQLNTNTGKWNTIKSLNPIKPRYLSGSGPGGDANTVYFFGGYGNSSGKQQLSPENLYDLYTFNLKNFSIKKIWEMDAGENNFVVGNSLKIDTTEKVFYALCFPRHKSSSHLSLGKFSLSKPEFTVVGDSIPYPFQDTQSFADLYYHEGKNELLAITSSNLSGGQTEINIYSIAFPVIGRHMLNQQITSLPNNRSNILFLIISIALLSAGSFIFFYRRNRTKLSATPEIGLTQVKTGNRQKPQTIDSIQIPTYTPLKKNSILLTGGLRLTNVNGQDLATSLTPILQHIFVLILLSTIKNSKGISSIQMKEILWPDKSDESARNNRGVNIRKLRLFLDNFEKINIISENSHWRIEWDDAIFCDYIRIYTLINRKEVLSEEELEELLDLTKPGPLLPELNYEWLDDFKSNYTRQLTDVLFANAKQYYASNNYQTLMKISDIIFSLDPMNEESLSLKCSLLKKQGKNALAKNIYNAFLRDYKSLMGDNFNRSFDELNFK